MAGRNVAVVCLYCDFLSQKKQSTTNMIGSILKQLVSGLEELPEELKKAFRKEKWNIGGRSLELPDFRRILKPVLGLFKQVFICIDALDEFLAEDRLGFIEELRWILQESPDVRLFLTGGPHDMEPDAMNKSSEEDIIRNLPDATAEMYVGVVTYKLRLFADTSPNGGKNSGR